MMEKQVDHKVKEYFESPADAMLKKHKKENNIPLGKHCGINPLRRFFFTFQGKNKEGDVIFSETIVKSKRPSDVVIVNFNEPQFDFAAKHLCNQFSKETNDFMVNKINNCLLVLRDGTGYALESWKFFDSVLTLHDFHPDAEYYKTEWKISYKTQTHQNHCEKLENDLQSFSKVPTKRLKPRVSVVRYKKRKARRSFVVLRYSVLKDGEMIFDVGHIDSIGFILENLQKYCPNGFFFDGIKNGPDVFES